MQQYPTNDANGDADSGSDIYEGELLHNYNDAVACLIDCEAVISSLQRNIASKGDQIARLEEKLIQMSLELAESKANEDALTHRMTKHHRICDNDDSVDNRRYQASPNLPAIEQQRQRCSCGISVETRRHSSSCNRTKMHPYQRSASRSLCNSISSLDTTKTGVTDTSMMSFATALSSLANFSGKTVGAKDRPFDQQDHQDHYATPDESLSRGLSDDGESICRRTQTKEEAIANDDINNSEGSRPQSHRIKNARKSIIQVGFPTIIFSAVVNKV